MLGIPFLTTYINKVVKVQDVADSVDWLNYYVTSILLGSFAFAISAKQYFGKPIQCWTPQEFGGGWNEYTHDYCFINNMYGVPMNESIPDDLQSRGDHMSYYRWVPVMLALQSVLFFLPNYIWNCLHKKTSVNPRTYVHDIRKCDSLSGEDRDKAIEAVARHIDETLLNFDPHYSQTTLFTGWKATFLYLGIKFLYLVNALGQLVLLNEFLGGSYLSWGFTTLMDVVQGKPWVESELFPRVIMCDFTVRRLANWQRYTVQCVVMMNMINEKLYFFLYWWLLLLAASTLVNFVYYFFSLLVPYFRAQFIWRNVNKSDPTIAHLRRDEFAGFVNRYLCPDGVLLLNFVRQHVGGRTTFDLLNNLIHIYKARLGSSIESSPTLLKGYRNDNYKKNLEEHMPTYKPTGYGPSGLAPPYPGQNDSSDMDFIDNQATLPMSQAIQRTPVRPAMRGTPSAPSENLYASAPSGATSSNV
uniref:Innexin n=1 Tax=Panagrellus redivivus TaxID=6233 RepID=A0A7E4VTA3_PANRE